MGRERMRRGSDLGFAGSRNKLEESRAGAAGLGKIFFARVVDAGERGGFARRPQQTGEEKDLRAAGWEGESSAHSGPESKPNYQKNS